MQIQNSASSATVHLAHLTDAIVRMGLLAYAAVQTCCDNLAVLIAGMLSDSGCSAGIWRTAWKWA